MGADRGRFNKPERLFNKYVLLVFNKSEYFFRNLFVFPQTRGGLGAGGGAGGGKGDCGRELRVGQRVRGASAVGPRVRPRKIFCPWPDARSGGGPY